MSNDPDDKLRIFLQHTFARSWTELLAAGINVFHAVKCAIRPSAGFQNPPAGVVDTCAPQHLAAELREVKPPVIATLGGMAYRAVYQALATTNGFNKAGRLKLSEPPCGALLGGEGYEIRLPDLALFAGPFIRGAGRPLARRLLKQAALRAGVLGGTSDRREGAQ